MVFRELNPGDAPALERFLVSHRDSSMFLRANSRRAGLVYRGAPFEATYVAALDGESVVGVAAHCWNGMMLLQAPEHAEAAAVACAGASERRVTGLSGPLEQVRRARTALGLAGAPARLDGYEWLYALDLSELVIPDRLAEAVRACRPPRPDERETLCAWRLAYDIEALGATDSEGQRRQATAFLDQQIGDGNVWVAIDEGAPVSLSAFNATLPDIVQLGGIFTPPALRGRGFAKAAVAASLIAARERGVSRAVLFTDNPSAARTYEALGFRRVGDYGLVLFR